MPPLRWNEPRRPAERRAHRPRRAAQRRRGRRRAAGPPATAGMLRSPARPSDTSAVVAASENGPSSRTARVDLRRDGARRRPAPASPASASAPRRRSVGRSSARKRGSRRRVASRSARRSAVAVATCPIVADRRARPAGARAPAAPAPCPRPARARRGCRFWRARMASTSSSSRSAGSARRITAFRSRPRPARPGAERVEDDREPLPVGLAHDPVDQVEVDRGRGVLAPAAGAPARPAVTRSGGGTASPAARACVGSHSTKRSPISDCGRTRHAASARKSWKAGSSMRSTSGGARVGRHLDVLHHADADAGHLDVLARDHEAGVVEDRPHAVGLLAAAQDDDDRRERGGREEHGHDRQRARHGPGGTWVGSQSRAPATSRHGRRAVGRAAGSRRRGSGGAGPCGSPRSAGCPGSARAGRPPAGTG